MEFWVILFSIVAVIIAYISLKDDARRHEIIECRKAYVASISPTARIIVNNGIHLFFKDDDKEIFGLDESGTTYDFSGLHSIIEHSDGISLMHRDSVSLCIGKDYSHQETTSSLNYASVFAIKAELLPVLLRNLHKELQKAGVSSTHEYEHHGEIWGCDINSNKFYIASGAFSIHNFSDLRRVTIEDLSNNSLCSSNYCIHVYVKWDNYDDWEYEIYFQSKDTTFYNLLAMFKGIQNRKNK